MSEAHIHSTATDQLEPTSDGGTRIQTSFLERFLNSFFQEKNIKWMLVVGAAIVFGSSLMLVTKAWPHWNPTLKYLTILGYTAATFAVAEVGRKRLGLTSTYKVLHALTLLLLPICFLSLTWLSSGTAVQDALRAVEVIGLLIPATAFLWFASSRILDHLLRGRQTSFLVSYQILCVAGAMPLITNGVAAFSFLSVCWIVFTLGVTKVNRHVFWLAEEHRMPRVFGFLPIAMLGLQFLVLVATKTFDITSHGVVAAIPLHWMGLASVMVAATVLLTARAVADVFRQRTGDLVRPLPWHIVVPLFSGLVLAATGVFLSLDGFHMMGPTTFAVIPTATVAALLMGLTARDTRHSGFVWAGLIFATVAYQCSPTLFSNIVQQLKEGVEVAIHERRLPIAFYGLTYLPLLLTVAAGSRYFARRSESAISRPMKHFVTVISLVLFCAVVTNWKAMLLVSAVNVPAFIILAMLFSDRRYVIPGIGAIVLAVGSALPALQGMRLTEISNDYIATALAGLAALLTATGLPDRLLNRIPIHAASILRYRDVQTDALTERSILLQRPDGSNRGLCQLSGCFLAALTSAHWISYAALHFYDTLTQPALLQFAFLLSALVLYTIRNPHYVTGLGVWLMVAFAAVRWAAGLSMPPLEMINGASLIVIGTSVLAYVWLKATGQISKLTSLNDLRIQLGVNSRTGTFTSAHQSSPSFLHRIQALVVPLCDLSLLVLSSLAMFVHLPLLLKAHWPLFHSGAEAGELMISTTATVAWLVMATIVLRSRITGIAAALAVPLFVSAILLATGVPLTLTWAAVVWVAVAGTIRIGCRMPEGITQRYPVLQEVSTVATFWLQGVLMISCLTYALPMRLAAALALVLLLVVDLPNLNQSRRSFYAITANIQLLLLAAAAGGATGLLVSPTGFATGPFVFLAAAISALLFDEFADRLDRVIATTWSTILRVGMLLILVCTLSAGTYAPIYITIMICGFVFAAAGEIRQAMRRQEEVFVWTACSVGGAAALFLLDQGVISIGSGKSQFVLLSVSIASLVVAKLSESHTSLLITRRPMMFLGQTLPTLVAILAVCRELSGAESIVRAGNSLALMMAAGIYFQQAMVTRKRRFAIIAAVILNIGFMMLWASMSLTRAEFYLVPVGLTILAFVELLKKELPRVSHDPLRYIGALTILVSPAFQLFGQSWVPVLSLMVMSVLVILLAIGLRLRALVYTGTAFLVTDLIAMVLRSHEVYPLVPWFCGIALGAGVIAFAAFCENHREKVLTQIRMLSAELATWG